MWHHNICWKRPDRIESGAPYFGKSLPVRPLSLFEFLRWCLLSRRLWFVVCFGKLSHSDISIRNNRTASDRVSMVAKVPSKWRGRRKGLNFGHAVVWSVGCRSIQLEISNWEFHIVQFIKNVLKISIYICSCCDGCIEEDVTQLCAPGTSPHQTPIFSEWRDSSFREDSS